MKASRLRTVALFEDAKTQTVITRSFKILRFLFEKQPSHNGSEYLVQIAGSN